MGHSPERVAVLMLYIQPNVIYRTIRVHHKFMQCVAHSVMDSKTIISRIMLLLPLHTRPQADKQQARMVYPLLMIIPRKLK